MIGTVIQRNDTPSSQEFFFVHENGSEIGKGGYIQYENNGTVIARVGEVYTANEYFENAESIAESLSNSEDLRDKFLLKTGRFLLEKPILWESSRTE